MAPRLEQVMTLRAIRSPNDNQALGPTQGGTVRLIVPLTGGHLKGEGFEAEAIPGGSDFLRFDTTSGTGYIDARLAFREKSTGDVFYVQMPGIIRMDAKIQAMLDGSPEAKTTESKDHYDIITPVFEVSSDKYKWMERTVFIGHGHFVILDGGASAIEFEIYQVLSG